MKALQSLPKKEKNSENETDIKDLKESPAETKIAFQKLVSEIAAEQKVDISGSAVLAL